MNSSASSSAAASLGLPLSQWTSPFDVFLGATAPFLDEYLSPEDQSFFIELFFWVCAYLVYGAAFSEWLRSKWSKTSYWNSGVNEKIGVFCGNAQDDIILLNMLALHHLAGGSHMILSVLLDDINLFRHGILIELGFEVADVLSMNPIFPMYPYRHEGMKIDGYAAFLFHHIPCIYFSILCFQDGLGTNHHLQQIAIYYIFGAALSALMTIFVITRNVETQLGQATASLIVTVGSWYYGRFHIGFQEGRQLGELLANDPEWKDTNVAAFFPKFAVLLMIFNGIVLLDGSARIIRYCMRMYNGTTPLEFGTAPLSREQRFQQASPKAKAL